MRIALGGGVPSIAAGAAALLTLATVNAYLTGASALAAHLSTAGKQSAERDPGQATAKRPKVFFAFVAAAGFTELIAESVGLLNPARMVTQPTALFLVVYIGSTASAARVIDGRLRVAAVLACLASAFILAFCGLLALFALLVGALALAVPALRALRA
jgi:amino acid efflux transporter